jgi:hypothetical protein
MAGLLFIGVLHTLFFTVLAGFFNGMETLVGLVPTADIFCGFLKICFTFFIEFAFDIESFGDMFAEMELYCLRLVVFFKCGGTIGF